MYVLYKDCKIDNGEIEMLRWSCNLYLKKVLTKHAVPFCLELSSMSYIVFIKKKNGKNSKYQERREFANYPLLEITICIAVLNKVKASDSFNGIQIV